jgi:N-acetylmuramoyl-L-alanine amidase
MKYAIDFGHNSPRDTGANGFKFEDDLVREVGKLLVQQLKDNGDDVILTQPPNPSSSVNASLNYRCRVANQANADIFVSLHFNSFNLPSANGTEVWIASPNSRVRDEAALVVQNIAKLGFTNRGIKCGNFRVLTGTDMPAMLIEGCFVSSKKDMNLFNPLNMATAIFNGLKGNRVIPIPDVETHKENAKLKVTHITLLKPSTKQSSQIDTNLLKNIDIGEYEINLLADEEGHYLITFDNQELFGVEQFFIFSEHCEILNV